MLRRYKVEAIPDELLTELKAHLNEPSGPPARAGTVVPPKVASAQNAEDPAEPVAPALPPSSSEQPRACPSCTKNTNEALQKSTQLRKAELNVADLESELKSAQADATAKKQVSLRFRLVLTALPPALGTHVVGTGCSTLLKPLYAHLFGVPAECCDT